MLNYIWSGLIAVSVLCALFMGNTADISNALIESGASSIQLILTMAGIICLWSGIMKIAVESGLTNIFAKIFAPLLRPLFPRLDKKKRRLSKHHYEYQCKSARTRQCRNTFRTKSNGTAAHAQ